MREEGVSLFPMFNILVCTLGVMVFVLATVATVSLGADKAVEFVSDDIRKAREMGVEQGFTVQWNPDEMDFPFVHRLAGGSLADLLRSRSVQSKPQC